MIRVFLDTNILVSALLQPPQGLPRQDLLDITRRDRRAALRIKLPKALQ